MPRRPAAWGWHFPHSLDFRGPGGYFFGFMVQMILPEWVRGAVFYEVYPQSFFDSNADGVGDLEGVRRKLDYIRSTGATSIWLNPFYVSPMRDAGYDVADFVQVDPRYGRMEDAERLFAEAHAMGLRVILDFVPGHTSVDHPWFRESARRDAARPFRNWYVWTASAWDDGGEPWNRKMIHGYSSRDGNFLVNFFWSQPTLNYGFAKPEADKPWQLPTTHPDVRLLWEEMRGVMRFWLEKGADGFRVDMADSLIRNDPGMVETRRFWREARQELEKDFPDLFLVAEGHPSNLLDGTGFHAAFLHWTPGYAGVFRSGEGFNQELGMQRTEAYFSRSGRGDFRPYLDAWRGEAEATRGRGVVVTPVGNHDLSRVAVGQNEEDLEMVFAFQAAWPGIPFIYYGDEIGMRQQSAENPIHEGHYPPRNGARTPLQWEPGQNCGFSECAPEQLHLPVDPAPGGTTVSEQEARADSLLHRVRALMRLHRGTAAFAVDAELEILGDGSPGEPLVFVRHAGGGGQRVLCFFQPAEKAGHWEWPGAVPLKPLHLLASGARVPVPDEKGIQTAGPAWAMWEVQKDK